MDVWETLMLHCSRIAQKTEIFLVHLAKLQSKTFQTGPGSITQAVSFLFSCDKSREWLLQDDAHKTTEEHKQEREEVAKESSVVAALWSV